MTISAPPGVTRRRLPLAALLAAVITVSGAEEAQAQTKVPVPAAGPASAEPSSPFYLSITASPAKAPLIREHGSDAAAQTDPGFRVAGIVGYAFSSNLRAEIEAFYRRDRLDAAPGQPPALDMTFTPSVPVPGGAGRYGGMARGVWEFGETGGFTPYVGGGVGLAAVDYDITVDGERNQEEENLLAWEFTAGARYNITPSSYLRAGYRVSGTTEPETDPAHPHDRIHAFEFGINLRF